MAYIGNSPGVASQRVVTQFTATSNQTTFIPTSGYTIGYLDVFLNGVKLVSGDDYTASNGTTVVLAEGAAADDSVEVVSFIPRGLSDGWLKSEADTRYLQLGASFSGDVSGTYSAITLANSGVTAGSYGSATNIPAITVDSKGRITSVTNTAVSIPSGSLTFTGDVTGSGSTGSSTSLTLANSGVTAGSYGSASAIPQITVDSKGRVTSISTTAVTVPTTLTVAASSGLTENINLSTGQLLLEAGTGVSTGTGAGKVTIAIGQAVSTTSNVSFNNLTLAGELRGPSTLIIDPAAVGDDTGTVRVRGNLQVDGTTTTVNSTTLEVADLNIVVGKNATNAAAANGAGITIGNYASNPTILYASSGDNFAINRTVTITGALTSSSYANVGSIVANDPGSNYYSWNNRIGGGLAVVGTLYIANSTNIWSTNGQGASTAYNNNSNGFFTNAGNISLSNRWATLNFPTDYTTANSTKPWWMFGRLTGDETINLALRTGWNGSSGGSDRVALKIGITGTDIAKTINYIALSAGSGYSGSNDGIYINSNNRVGIGSTPDANSILSTVGSTTAGVYDFSISKGVQVNSVGMRLATYATIGSPYSAWDLALGCNARVAVGTSNSGYQVATNYIAGGASLLQVGFQELMWHKWSPAQLSGFSKGSPLSSSIMFKIDASGHVLPGANGTQNLGSTSLRWATVYTSDLSLSNGIGDWTIVEGEDDLFIYNNKRNRVYKFKLEEIDPATAVPRKEV